VPSFLAFVALDLFWIAVVAKDLYAGLKPVLKPDPDAAAALLSWICIVLGNYVFVLPRTGGGKPAWHVIGQVGFVGVCGRAVEGRRAALRGCRTRACV
jgi:hypothetical protein